MLDEYFLGASLKEVEAQRTQRSKPQVKAPSRVDRGSLEAGPFCIAVLSRNATLSFQTFSAQLRRCSALGAGDSLPSALGRSWELVPNPSFENDQVKRGRFVAQLKGPVGKIRFGRPVSLQSVDLCVVPRKVVPFQQQ